ncbi:MAG TPA: ribokinase [Candidatus Sulfotelmatobacter sp.]|nr:ribokinase [Candidatus Sulfotelmatobacter sp.]
MQYCRMGEVVVLGSINMDLVVRVPSLPRPGDTVLGDRLLTIPGGKGANQAVAAARLGASVRMIGRVGRDLFGADLIAGLKQDRVDTSGVTVDPAQPSGAALIVVDSSGQNTITVAPGANSAVGDEEVTRLRDGLRPDDVVILQLEIPIAAVLSAIRAAHDAGARVILNAAPSAAMVGLPVPDVDLLMVNEGEAEELGRARLRRSVRAVAVTLGAEGAMLYERDRTTRIDPRRVDAVDSTAAGDAMVGAAAFSLARGSTIADAIRLGGAAGAAAVTKVGARPSLPRPDDLKRLFGIDIEGTFSRAKV